MEDSNLIAWLSPAIPEDENVKDKKGKYTWEAIRMNTSLDIPPWGGNISDYRSRESTASLEDEEDHAANAASYPRLHLAFNSGLKSGLGLMFGTDSKRCDIVLPRLRYISQRHCYLTFDVERRLILRDFSTHGTIVRYDEKGGELRRHFTWILGGHDVPRRTKKIVVEIQGVSFRIAVSHVNKDPDLYNAKVNRFLQEADEPHLNGLGIESPTPRGARTPNQGPIRLKQEILGKGTFAVVRRFWDVSNGVEYAYKEPRDKRRFDRKAWEKEIDIMRQISHDHVVMLVDSTLTPSPRLILEYVPSGSLKGHELSLEESMIVLCQGLSALADLHEREVPIVHRDIKPANILIKSLDPLYIKFTDFGLSKASNDLKTFCGTRSYLAPEVYRKKSYTPAVDIWSLGVAVFECAYGLPDGRGYQGRDWCELLVDQINDWENGDLIDLLSSAMIVMNPQLRLSARDCHMEASQLTIASQERCSTPTPASYIRNDNNSISSGRLTAVPYRQSSQNERSTRRIRADALSPDTYSSTRKRSTSSTSPSGRLAKRHRHPQQIKSEPVIELFGEGWLQDPNCVGSSVAAMGQESSNWSSWGDPTTEPLEALVPRSIPDYGSYQVGNASAQDAYGTDPIARGEVDEASTDSQGHIAVRLLQGMREAGYL